MVLTLMNQHTSEDDFDEFAIVKKHTKRWDPFFPDVQVWDPWDFVHGYLKTLDGDVWAVRMNWKPTRTIPVGFDPTF